MRRNPVNTPAVDAQEILVWDAPVRVFHWCLALSFFGAYLTAESERWRVVHVSLGYTAGALVAFRLVWGLIGTRHARFAAFVRGPQAVLHYARSLLRGEPEHHVGHNPAGALGIVALLTAVAITVGLGWAKYTDRGGDWVKDVHELMGNLTLALVGLHVAAVLLSSWLHRENLVRAMVTGRKLGAPQEAIGGTRRALAGVIVVAVLAFLGWQFKDAPGPGLGQEPVGKHRHHEHGAGEAKP